LLWFYSLYRGKFDGNSCQWVKLTDIDPRRWIAEHDATDLHRFDSALSVSPKLMRIDWSKSRKTNDRMFQYFRDMSQNSIHCVNWCVSHNTLKNFPIPDSSKDWGVIRLTQKGQSRYWLCTRKFELLTTPRERPK
jgi:hypothetical protein